MALPEQITTREYQKFIDHAPGQTKVRVSVADPVVSAPVVTTRTIENISILAANTEQSHSFPANTLMYRIKARGPGRLELRDASGGDYLTIWPGSGYESPFFNASAVSIYLKSPTAGLIIEAESWA
jgi:hypothetical protein